MATMSCSSRCYFSVALFIFQGLWIMTDALALKTRTERSSSNCPEGWDTFGNKCYRMFGADRARKTWTEANRECQNMRSNLVSVHSTEEQRFLESYFQHTEYDIWIGMHIEPVQEEFQWTDGSPVDFTHWDSGEPNRHGNSEDCVHMNFYLRSQGKWNDHRCTRTFPYICQISKGVCGESYVSDQGFISSPNYPDKYQPNLECHWNITVPEDSQVSLKFESMEIEPDADCLYDYVKILDGHDTSSPALGSFCGYSIPEILVSSGNKMSIEFKTDSTFQFNGFRAEFKKDSAIRVELENLIRQVPGAAAQARNLKLKDNQANIRKKKSILENLKQKFMTP